MKNDLFLRPGALLDDIALIRQIPGIIVQGRYDIVCPARTAFDLSLAWPEATLKIIPAAGHSALEPAIRDELLVSLEQMKALARW